MLYESESGDILMALTGESMITRGLSMFREAQFLKLRQMLIDADVSFTNAECVFQDFSDSPNTWGGGGNPKATYLASHPCNIKELQWLGIDVGSSPEVDSRTRTDVQFLTYDGINIPLSEGSVDMIYCHQVLEHIADPRAVLKEVFRALKPGGYFVGSTSQLEPFHTYSFWNYTAYGFSILVGEAGLELMEIRPSIDSFTLILRAGLRKPKFFNWFWKRESPLNLLISLAGFLLRKPHAWINAMKLLFSGQFCFLVRKPAATDE